MKKKTAIGWDDADLLPKIRSGRECRRNRKGEWRSYYWAAGMINSPDYLITDGVGGLFHQNKATRLIEVKTSDDTLLKASLCKFNPFSGLMLHIAKRYNISAGIRSSQAPCNGRFFDLPKRREQGCFLPMARPLTVRGETKKK